MENSKVFFSYSRADSEFVLRLAKDLRSQGIDLWIDQLDIAAGDRWDKSVEDALEAAPSLLVVLSPASVESHNVMDEVSLAFDERKKIVPVLARACTIPFRLRRLQNIDFTVDYDRGLEAVVKALSLRPEPAVQPVGSGPERSIEAPRVEPARTVSLLSSPVATRRKSTIYVVIAASILVVAAGGISFVVFPRYFGGSKSPDAPVLREAETAALAPAKNDTGLVANSAAVPDMGQTANVASGPEAVPLAKLAAEPDADPLALLAPGKDAAPAAKQPPGSNEPAAPQSPPPPDTSPKVLSMLPPPPAQPVNGTWDITMSCRDGSQVNEQSASFTRGTYARTYKTEYGGIDTQLALGYIDKSTVRLTGSVTFEKYGVQAVDATGTKKGKSFVGLGTYGTSKNCRLTITDRN